MSKKAIPYPRPVSPLSIDEIPVCPTTTVYYDLNLDDTDHEAERRASKRRKRVRDNAEAYLRGESIFIMTAALRGPFDKSSKNPWAKNKSRRHAEKEVPETNAAWERRKPVVPDPTKIRHGQNEYIDLTGDDIEFTQPPVVVAQPPKDVFVRNVAQPHVIHPCHAPMSDKRVEEWLRTNDAYETEHMPEMRSSPTPVTRNLELSATETRQRRPLSAGGTTQNTQVGAWAKRFSPGQENESTQQTHESQDRAEVAILKTKMRSVHRVPPSTNLPAFEYKRPKAPQKRMRAGNKHSLAPESGFVEASDISESRGEPPEPRQPSKEASGDANGFVKPALSAETSKATTSRDLPEAQIVSEIVPEVWNAQSTAQLLEPVETPAGHSTAQNRMTEVEQSDTAPSRPQESSIQSPNNIDHILERQHNSSGDEGRADKENQTPLRTFDTQALLGSIQPFAVSTIKKVAATREARPKPVTGTTSSKAKVGRSTKKKASFAADAPSDESQSSIKAGFQVRKSASINVLPTKNPEGTSPEDEDERYDLGSRTKDENQLTSSSFNEHHTPIPDKSKTKVPFPKSILKSRTPKAPISSSAPPGTTVTVTGASLVNTNGTYQSSLGTSATKQDAQSRPRDMFAIENGTGAVDSHALEPDVELQQFDLDAVVDDLGSFLGTWDVEREVDGVA